MRCSGCGKEIPFAGAVCPYCHRDKSKDQAYTVTAFILGSVFGFLGYKIFGWGGAIGGFIIGCIVAVIATGVGVNKKPPEVIVVNEKQQEMQMIRETRQPEYEGIEKTRLRKLKELFDGGLIGEDEYKKKKNEILEKI